MMVMWFTNWLTRRIVHRRRQIFRYFDGRCWRMGDPFRLWRALESHETFNLDTMHEAIDDGIEPECSIGLAAIQEVFQIAPYDGRNGLQDWELGDLLARFLEYISDVKKKPAPGLTSPAATDPESSTDPMDRSETTSCSSDSSSTSNGKSCGKAGASCEP